eukprot:CAMPEP_0173436498 /NCGR_PEP_ID=MMETSP1357-20121228/16267_1 /TAXON_ID=77926 /ORGANISM="Hemiselmis rufescens, Strain PCC563" /LENGTH=468 /DNA_ID=CAMNT_0014401581 /DNA_START=136 /DNA_END=1542 /DNA_ORIENTATION=-
MSGEGLGYVSNELPLPEGRYPLMRVYSATSDKPSVNHRVTKSSYIKAQAVRQASEKAAASPASKGMSMLNFTKKFSSQAPPTPPPPVVTGESADYYVFCSGGDTLCVCTLSLSDQDPVVTEKVFQSSDPTCCAANPRTSAVDNLVTLVGFESGEILLIDALTGTTTGKFNVGSAQNSSCVTDLQWVPESPNMFVAAFGNGVMLVYDTDKEDRNSTIPNNADASGVGEAGFVVLHPKTTKNNPIARWLVTNGPINNINFSANGKLMALSCHDGHCRIFDFAVEKLVYSFRSHYGAILCSAWSPDNKFLVTGGEDDLVVAWAWVDKVPVACCKGHNSWISSIAFDRALCDTSDEHNYRFHTVAQDGRLCTWDLNEGNLVFSRKRAGTTSRRTSFATPPAAGKSVLRNVAEVPRSDEMASLTPTGNVLIDQEPLSSVCVTPLGVVTCCFSGEAKLWARPSADGGTPRDDDD